MGEKKKCRAHENYFMHKNERGIKKKKHEKKEGKGQFFLLARI